MKLTKFERRVVTIDKWLDEHGVPQYVTKPHHPEDVGTALSVLCDAITGGNVAGVPEDVIAATRELGNVLARYHTGRRS